jgi:hypothetical protein
VNQSLVGAAQINDTTSHLQSIHFGFSCRCTKWIMRFWWKFVCVYAFLLFLSLEWQTEKREATKNQHNLGSQIRKKMQFDILIPWKINVANWRAMRGLGCQSQSHHQTVEFGCIFTRNTVTRTKYYVLILTAGDNLFFGATGLQFFAGYFVSRLWFLCRQTTCNSHLRSCSFILYTLSPVCS